MSLMDRNRNCIAYQTISDFCGIRSRVPTRNSNLGLDWAELWHESFTIFNTHTGHESDYNDVDNEV